jgi:hypothetical protein
MAITSIVVVADDQTVEGGGATLEFTPGGGYPVAANHPLSVKQQPFPHTEPTRVVPSIVAARFSYGQFKPPDGVGQQPAPFEPEEHSFREVSFSADYVEGSWQVIDNQGVLRVTISGGLRDNTPSGDAEPDDPFIAYLRVQAICIWTTEITLLDQLGHLVRSIGTIFKGQ